MNLFDISFSADFGAMLLRFILCMFVTWFIVDKLYYKKSRRSDFYFTFMLSSVAIFFLVFFMIFVLEDLKTKTSIGIGIGLFGIFSIMRYRTDAMPVREMTYLFVIVSLSVVNAIAASVTFPELLATDLIFILSIWLCERQLKPRPCKLIQYDRLELVKPENRDKLKADLYERLGIQATDIEVGGVDLLRDMAIIKVYYNEGKAVSDIDNKTRLKEHELSNG